MIHRPTIRQILALTHGAYDRRMARAGQFRRGGRGGGRPPKRWTPAELGDDLYLWAKATDDDITLNGSDVSGWADRSDRSNDGSQGTAADQPAWNSSDANFGGHASVQFDASNTEWFPFDGTVPDAASGDDEPFTVAITCKLEALAGSIWSFGGATGSVPVLYLGISSNKLRVSKFDDSSSGVSVDSTADWDTDPHVITVVHSGTMVTVYDCGTPIAGMDGVNQNVGQTTLAKYTLGARRRDPIADYSSVRIVENVVIGRALSAAEVTQLSSYLCREAGM